MDLKEIKELIALMRKNDLSVFKLEEEQFKITLKRGVDFQPLLPAPGQPAPPAATQLPAATPAARPGQEPNAGFKETLREIVSPMVGTFYTTPSPDSPPYVTPGHEVMEDSVVCIIEAMKVMNEIKAELRGTIVEVVAENGKPVQYGQVLYRVR